MGLDAVVFLRKERLPFNPDELGATLEPETGDYYIPNPAQDKFSLDSRTAASERIGNISAVAELRAQTEHVLPKDSIVLSDILYSGTHGGDAIPLAELSQLESELALLRKHAHETASELLQEFCDSFERLIAAARAERNPIVFA